MVPNSSWYTVITDSCDKPSSIPILEKYTSSAAVTTKGTSSSQQNQMCLMGVVSIISLQKYTLTGYEWLAFVRK
jgi:hypothetical protein